VKNKPQRDVAPTMIALRKSRGRPIDQEDEEATRTERLCSTVRFV